MQVKETEPTNEANVESPNLHDFLPQSSVLRLEFFFLKEFPNIPFYSAAVTELDPLKVTFATFGRVT